MTKEIANAPILVRATPTERVVIHCRAAFYELSLSRYLVALGVAETAPVEPSLRPLLESIYTELKYADNNTNQIAHAWNRSNLTDEPPPAIHLVQENAILSNRLLKRIKGLLS
jgi:hypothetical protein